jgi:hypothetical protein
MDDIGESGRDIRLAGTVVSPSRDRAIRLEGEDKVSPGSDLDYSRKS